MKRDVTAPDLDALARELAPRVLAEIARLVTKASEPAHYTSRRGGGPAGVPDREWKRIAAEIGRRPHPHARWMVVDRGAYDRWLAAQSPEPCGASVSTDAPWSPATAAAELGLRLVK